MFTHWEVLRKLLFQKIPIAAAKIITQTFLVFLKNSEIIAGLCQHKGMLGLFTVACRHVSLLLNARNVS